jgi:hypothetical protein
MGDNTIVVLKKIGTQLDTEMFDSVAAAAVYFAHEARRNYAKLGFKGDDLLEMVAVDTALLFAGYDRTTGEDMEHVSGGATGTSYEIELRAVRSRDVAKDDARTEDETKGK